MLKCVTFPSNQSLPLLRQSRPGKVGPQTGWLCPNDDCTPCDMYKTAGLQHRALARFFWAFLGEGLEDARMGTRIGAWCGMSWGQPRCKHHVLSLGIGGHLCGHRWSQRWSPLVFGAYLDPWGWPLTSCLGTARSAAHAVQTFGGQLDRKSHGVNPGKTIVNHYKTI